MCIVQLIIDKICLKKLFSDGYPWKALEMCLFGLTLV